MASKKWYRLDNAAKVFPSVSNRKRSNVFRLAFEMKELVDPLLLQKAVDITINRFPMLDVRLRKGFFWYYFENNEADPILSKETPHLCQAFEDYRETNGFLFRLSYFEKRIALEVFHSLSDGAGGLELLKSIVFTYLQLRDVHFSSSKGVLTENDEIIMEEAQDSFYTHSNLHLKKGPKDDRALKFKTPLYDDDWVGIIIGTAKVDQIKKLAEKYSCTITELLGAIVLYSASKNIHLFETKKRDFKLLIPVNLRRFFSSKSLRNFSLFVLTSMKLDDKKTFEDIVSIVKSDLKEELQKEKLQARFTATVKIEQNMLMRLAPRFIKELALKIGYHWMGDIINTFSLSNLGGVTLPDEMQEYVEKIVFCNGASVSFPLNLGVISYQNTITIAFTSNMIAKSIQRDFFRFLTKEGVEVMIEHNDLEV
ncbi:MAG: hypothetical protein PHP41_02805 [Bacilli bacterium]|nr:hypothetical protein [Bacilli bacterium]